jgi:hypothetical protein
MKKTILQFALAVLTLGTATAQKEVKYEKLFYKDVTKETSEVKITVDNAVATAGETKFKLKITNLTGDYIIFKPEESKFIINGKEMAPKEKWLIIKPNESDFRVINMKGAGYNEVKSYSFVVGGLYLASTKGTVVEAPNFDLPASKNEFEAGSFKTTMSNIYKESDRTEVKFKSAYNGSKIGFIQPAKVSVKMPDGKEYANAKSKADAIMLTKGQDDSFSLRWDRMEGGKTMDMQKVTMTIIWHDAYSESELKALNAEKIDMEFDQANTELKNKK